MEASAEEFSDWVTHRAYARVGLVGNPSDGYYGKTIAVAVDNFFAQAHPALPATNARWPSQRMIVTIPGGYPEIGAYLLRVAPSRGPE